MTCPLRVGGAVAVGLRSCWPTRCRCARTGCEPRESNGIRLLRSLAPWAAVVIVEGRLATSQPRARASLRRDVLEEDLIALDGVVCPSVVSTQSYSLTTTVPVARSPRRSYSLRAPGLPWPTFTARSRRPRSSARRSDSAIRAVPTPLPRCSGRTWRWQISTASGCATRPSAPTNPVHRITAEPRGSPSRHATRYSEEPCAAFDACASWTPPGTGHFSVRTVRSAIPRDLDRHGDGQRSHGEVHDHRRCIARRPCRHHRAASRAFPKTPRRRVLHDARWIRHPIGRRSTLCG